MSYLLCKYPEFNRSLIHHMLINVKWLLWGESQLHEATEAFSITHFLWSVPNKSKSIEF